ncbi:MAG: ribonuclease H family protein [Clostridiaceae bacterium]
MGKYYAVINGHANEPVILESWEACKKEVTGAKGVKFKSFATLAEAKEFISLHEEHGETKVIVKKKKKPENIEPPITKLEHPVKTSDEITIYVDGSYELSSERYAYGLVAVESGEEIYIDKKAFKSEFSSMRNVAGEVLGAVTAMKYAKGEGYKKLKLYFDYQGIESWALGTWKRNNKLTQGYHEFYKEIRQELQVKFVKVKGHSGDEFNDRADELAKSAFL